MKNLSRDRTWALKIIVILLFLFLAFPSQAVNPLEVVINEIAWMGATNLVNDEWMELYNNTDNSINLDDWQLVSQDGTPKINLSGTIPANGFYLLERTNDDTVLGISADKIYTGALNNSGENLKLYDNLNNLIEEINCSAGWFAGLGKPEYKTMERINSLVRGNDPSNWQTSQNPGGTPRAKNSVVIEPDLELPLQEEKTQPELQSEIEEPKPITYPSGIVINEILPDPEGMPDAEGEYIEIFNENKKKINLSDWKIADAVGSSAKTYTFPEDTIIKEEGFLVFNRATTKIILNNDGDSLSLIQPDGKVVDSVIYKEKAPKGESYNRIESGWTWTPSLTPGSANIIPAPVSESKETEPSIEEVKESALEKEPETQKELAAVGEQVPKSSKSLYVFLIALGIAIFSGIIILILKKKLKKTKFDL